MLLPGLVALALMPYLIYLLHPPEIKSTPNAMQFARDKLKELGPISRGELTHAGVFAVLLVLWAGIPALLWPRRGGGPNHHGLHRPVAVPDHRRADLGRRHQEKSAWDTIIWFGALVMMATFLNKLGLIALVCAEH